MAKQLELTRGQFAIVDDADFTELQKWPWHATKNGKYWEVGCTSTLPGAPYKKSMSRFLMDAKPGIIVDHIDGNRLNNVRSNLRLANKHQNGCNSDKKKSNTSGYKGVSKNAAGRWIAQITCHRTFHWLGSYATKKEAAAAYDAAATILHGQFARTNKMLGLL